MKVNLKFNLPDEDEEFIHAINGSHYYSGVNEFDNLLRSHLKYENNPNWDTDTVEELRDKFNEIMDEHRTRSSWLF